MQAPFHYILFLLTSLFGQETTLIADSCKLNIDFDAQEVVLELKNLRIAETDEEEVTRFMQEFVQNGMAMEMGSYVIEELNFSQKGNSSNATVTMTYADEFEFLQEFTFFRKPNGDVVFYPYPNEKVKSSNGKKAVFQELNVIEWKEDQPITIKLNLTDTESLNKMLTDYYGKLKPFDVNGLTK